MRTLRLFAAFTIVAATQPAFAATTWTQVITAPVTGAGIRNAHAVCTTGTEAAPVDAGVEGVALKGLSGLTVHVKTGAGAMTAGGKLLAYVQNPVDGKWNYVADGSLDLTVAAVTSQSWPGLRVVSGVGRIAWVPSGVGLAVTIDINGT